MKTSATEKAIQVVSTLAIEDIHLTTQAKNNLMSIVKGEKTTKDILAELDKKYARQKVLLS